MHVERGAANVSTSSADKPGASLPASAAEVRGDVQAVRLPASVDLAALSLSGPSGAVVLDKRSSGLHESNAVATTLLSGESGLATQAISMPDPPQSVSPISQSRLQNRRDSASDGSDSDLGFTGGVTNATFASSHGLHSQRPDLHKVGSKSSPPISTAAGKKPSSPKDGSALAWQSIVSPRGHSTDDGGDSQSQLDFSGDEDDARSLRQSSKRECTPSMDLRAKIGHMWRLGTSGEAASIGDLDIRQDALAPVKTFGSWGTDSSCGSEDDHSTPCSTNRDFALSAKGKQRPGLLRRSPPHNIPDLKVPPTATVKERTDFLACTPMARPQICYSPCVAPGTSSPSSAVVKRPWPGGCPHGKGHSEPQLGFEGPTNSSLHTSPDPLSPHSASPARSSPYSVGMPAAPVSSPSVARGVGLGTLAGGVSSSRQHLTGPRWASLHVSGGSSGSDSPLTPRDLWRVRGQHESLTALDKSKRRPPAKRNLPHQLRYPPAPSQLPEPEVVQTATGSAQVEDATSAEAHMVDAGFRSRVLGSRSLAAGSPEQQRPRSFAAGPPELGFARLAMWAPEGSCSATSPQSPAWEWPSCREGAHAAGWHTTSSPSDAQRRQVHQGTGSRRCSPDLRVPLLSRDHEELHMAVAPVAAGGEGARAA